jgi:hypothetical protein
MKRKIGLFSTILGVFAILAGLVVPSFASAQQPPAVFFGNVRIGGQAVAAGTQVNVYLLNTLEVIGTTTTGSITGQAANDYRIEIAFQARFAGAQVGFSVVDIFGFLYTTNTAGQVPTSTYAGGSATRVDLNMQIPPTPTPVPPTPTRAPATATPPVPGDLAPSSGMLWGAIAAGAALVTMGGFLLLRRREARS